MKKTTFIYLAAALLTVGCAKEQPGSGNAGYGTLRFACTADAGIETAVSAEAEHPEAGTTAETIPSAGEFALTLTGEGYEKSWETIAAFTAENPLLEEGRYTATISYGDPEAEGPGKPYYTGSNDDIRVVALESATAEITARLGNAQAVVRATEQFREYYHDIRFTLTTGQGNTFSFDLDSEGYVEVPVYVVAGKSLSVTGTARRQSQTGVSEGVQETFLPEGIEAAEARCRHIFTFGFSQGGSATLTIAIGEDYTEEIAIDCELNEDSKM